MQQLEDANAFVSLARRGAVVVSLPPPVRRSAAAGAAPDRPGEIVGSLHRAAARWHAEHGDLVEAIRHAQAAGDWPHAIRLLADNECALLLDGRRATIRALLDGVPHRSGQRRMQSWPLACGIVGLRGPPRRCRPHRDGSRALGLDGPQDRRWYFDLRLGRHSARSGAKGWGSRMRRLTGSLCGGGPLAPPTSRKGRARCARQRRPGRRAHESRHRRALVAARWVTRAAPRAERSSTRAGSDAPTSRSGCLGPPGVAGGSADVPSGSPSPSGSCGGDRRGPRLGNRPIARSGLAPRARALGRLARFEEAEHWLRASGARCDRRSPGRCSWFSTVHGAAPPGAGTARGGAGRVARGREPGARRPSTHLCPSSSGAVVHTQASGWATRPPLRARSEMPAQERERAEMHIAAASVHLVEDNSRAATPSRR